MRGIDRGFRCLTGRGQRSVAGSLLCGDLGCEEMIVNRILKSTKLPFRVLLRGFGLWSLGHVLTEINTATPATSRRMANWKSRVVPVVPAEATATDRPATIRAMYQSEPPRCW